MLDFSSFSDREVELTFLRTSSYTCKDMQSSGLDASNICIHVNLGCLRCRHRQRKKGGSSIRSCETVDAEREIVVDFALMSQRTSNHPANPVCSRRSKGLRCFSPGPEMEPAVCGISSSRVNRHQLRGTLRVKKLSVNYSKGLTDKSRCLRQCCFSASQTSDVPAARQLVHFVDTS